MTTPPIDITGIVALLILPICAVTATLGVRKIVLHWMKGREERRRKKAIREKRIHLERL